MDTETAFRIRDELVSMSKYKLKGNDRTPLNYAILSGDLDSVKFLLDNGATGCPSMCVHSSVFQPNTKILETLLNHYNYLPHWGVILYSRNPDFVKLSINNGLDVNKIYQNYDALSMASSSVSVIRYCYNNAGYSRETIKEVDKICKEEVIKVLLDAGAVHRSQEELNEIAKKEMKREYLKIFLDTLAEDNKKASDLIDSIADDFCQAYNLMFFELVSDEKLYEEFRAELTEEMKKL